MPCNCKDLARIIRVNGTLQQLYPDFKHVATGAWKALVQCPDCGQLWSVDEWDKYQTQLAIKLEAVETWSQSDETHRKAFLMQSRGLSTQRCMWNGCGEAQLNNSAYCVDHLYAVGVRE